MHSSDLRPDAAVGRPSARNARPALLFLCLAQLMLVVDITAVNIALPTIAADLGMTGGATTWVVTAYVVAFGGFMLLGGRLADVVGRRRMLLVGLAAFTAASLACALADSSAGLVTARAFQGLGAAMISPAALAAVTALFHGAARVRALGAWAGVGAAGFVGGLLVSGALVAGPGWRWVFFINIPVCALLFAAIPRLLPADGRRRAERVDVGGAVLATGAIGLLVLGLSRLGDDGLDPVTLACLGIAGLASGLFVVVESRQSSPLIAPRVLRQRPVVTGLVVMLAASAAMLVIFFLTSMYAQRTLGLSALETGLLFAPSAVATMVSAHLASHVIVRHGARAAAVGGFLTSTAGAALLTQISAGSSVWGYVVPALVLTSLGLGPVVVVATSSTLARVAEPDAGVASGIVNTGHEVGGAFGLALLSAVLGGGLTGTSPDAYATGFLGVAAVALVMAVVCAIVVPPTRPDVEHLRHGH